MNLKPLIIGDLKAEVPIVQGGMGVGVSLSNLASAVAKEGGIGIISAAHPGYREDDFYKNTLEADKRALKNEIKKAKEKSNGGIIGVNIMAAMNHYEDYVKASIDGGADLIVSGAGLPVDLPKFAKGSNVKIGPIVSSGKAADVMCHMWKSRYDYTPDFIVVEGPKAGGHLGFKSSELGESREGTEETCLSKITKDVIKAISKYGKDIPVIVGGGVYTGEDIAKFLNLGASGVQIATRFICTDECDADIEYKKAFIKYGKDDIAIIKSPVGLLGRAFKNDFVKKVENGNIKVTRCVACLKKCNPANTPYCITKALINAVKGDVDNGLIFTGTNGYRNKEIIPVKTLMNELIKETEECLQADA